MRITSRFSLVVVVAGLLSCEKGRPADSPRGQDGASDPASPDINVSTCPATFGPDDSKGVCAFDSNGTTYPVNGTVYILPAAPPYGAIFEVSSDTPPMPEDIISEGPNAVAMAYAALAKRNDSTVTGCCPENNEANRIPIKISLRENHTLKVVVNDAVPVGYKLVIVLHYQALYRWWLTSGPDGSCGVPNAVFCSINDGTRFNVRFYVGAEPPL
jgi:hypothetical protein